MMNVVNKNITDVLGIVDLKKRSDIHWARKLWHMLGVSALALSYAYLPKTWSLTALIIVCALFIPADLIRQKNQSLNDLLVHIFRPILRDQEVHKIAGTTYLLTGVLIVTLIFPREIVMLTLLFLAFADPIASYFGIRYGKDKIFGHKSLQGSLAAFSVCALITFSFLYVYGIMLDRLLVISLLGGLIGALAEAIPIGKLDDNLTLPLLSAVALWVVFSLFGTFSNYPIFQ